MLRSLINRLQPWNVCAKKTGKNHAVICHYACWRSYVRNSICENESMQRSSGRCFSQLQQSNFEREHAKASETLNNKPDGNSTTTKYSRMLLWSSDTWHVYLDCNICAQPHDHSSIF
jgi:hypothetical protein